jgi:hypothetical protein
VFRSWSLGELIVTAGANADEAEAEKVCEYLRNKWGVGADESPETGAPRWYARQQAQLQIGASWTLQSPRVFRYLDQEHIDRFFETGELRLSSFAQFSEHEDEERKDQEGWTINIGLYEASDGPDKNVRVYNVSGAGADAYVLCGSLVESSDLLSAFRSTGYFVIEDPWGFATAVQRCIPGFVGGMQGHCIYSPRGRQIYRRLHVSVIDLMERHRTHDGKTSMDVLPEIEAALSGPERLFHKTVRLRHQAEYRILWGTSSAVEPHLFVTCPEAREFCARVT